MSDRTNISIHGVVWIGGKQSTPAMGWNKAPTADNGAKRIPLRAKNAAKQARCRRNRGERARINAEYRGETGSKKAAEYHVALRAVALGTW